jgi:hypothetical protein
MAGNVNLGTIALADLIKWNLVPVAHFAPQLVFLFLLETVLLGIIVLWAPTFPRQMTE